MIQFVRQRAFSYVTTEPLSQRQGFYFKLAATFSKEVDPLSGMTVNLIDVDRWMSAFFETIPANGFITKHSHPEEILRRSREYLEPQAAGLGAQLLSLRLAEERNWSLSWEQKLAAGFFLFECSHFFESFHEACPGLIRIFFVWERSAGSDFDCSLESLRLLKLSGIDSMASLDSNLNKLKALTKFQRGSEARVVQLRIEVKQKQSIFVIK